MNRIKIIKREAVQLSPIQKNIEPAAMEITKLARPEPGSVVADWVGEWREKKQKDAERSLADLLQFKSPADCRAC